MFDQSLWDLHFLFQDCHHIPITRCSWVVSLWC